MLKPRTISMEDDEHKKARIIAANLDQDSVSALIRYWINQEWDAHYSDYKNFVVADDKKE